MAGDEWFGVERPDKPCCPNATQERLELIAQALGQPASDFYGAEGQTTREAETLALGMAFDRITDSEARARCVAFVTAQANATASAG